LLAWHMEQSGKRSAVVERRWVGGSCPNIACMPRKNEIWSARVAHLTHHAANFGTVTGTVSTIVRSPSISKGTRRPGPSSSRALVALWLDVML